VLFRENLGRRHEDGLMAIPGRSQHGYGRDNGFSRADVALEQAIHRVRLL
jgi:hypothetical protein